MINQHSWSAIRCHWQPHEDFAILIFAPRWRRSPILETFATFDGGRPHDRSVLRTYPPNNKIPAIVDHVPVDGGAPLSLFESGEILLYLAEKSGKLLSGELRERHTTLQWLFWQVGGLGPMLGQNHHFNHHAPQAVPYAIERYQVESQRLYGVMNRRLETSPWLGGEHYSIADIACWPWINAHSRQRIDLSQFPAVHNWFERIRQRPATQQALLKTQQY